MEHLQLIQSAAPLRRFGDTDRCYLRPVGLLRGDVARRAVENGLALTLAGGPLAFSACEVVLRGEQSAEVAWLRVPCIRSWHDSLGRKPRARLSEVLDRLTAPRPAFAGIELDAPCLMGVLNTTPDSFSDGGHYSDPDRAVAYARAMAESGAAIIDVGGESTRPGAEPVSPAEERTRTLAVVRTLSEAGIAVSIDTRNPATMSAAARAGARLINDVTALGHAPESMRVAAALGLPILLMHSAGDPRIMQDDPNYDHAALDIYDYFHQRIADCEAAGISRDRIAIDPGIGFGKTVRHNLTLIAWAGLFHGFGCPLAIGVSRKSTIARVAGDPAQDPSRRVPGSLALAQAACDQGVQILRVHDVAETAQAVALWRALG